MLSSCETMLVISSTFLPLGQPDNTEFSGNECYCKNNTIEFAISFWFPIIGELKMELLCFLNILVRKLGLERESVFTPKFSRMETMQ